jgi:hypothetical protein
MRKKYTFLLTILPTEENEDDLCGRIQLVQSNRAENFTNLEELRSLINEVLLSNPNDAGELSNDATITALEASSNNGSGLEPGS